MIFPLQLLLRLLGNLSGMVALAMKPRRTLEAEILLLGRQLALYRERGVKPRSIDAAARLSLVVLSR